MDDSIAISEQMYYYRHDHLGNNVAVWNAETNTTPQRTFYYASGLPMSMSTGQDLQNRKYNGKEFEETSGLNEYDNEARHYYPAVCRATTMDPLCEQYYPLSPYSWCGNNFVNAIDLDGMKWLYYPKQDNEDEREEYFWVEEDFNFDNVKKENPNAQIYDAIVVFEGSRYEFLGWKYNGMENWDPKHNFGYIDGIGAITADVTMYGPNGPDDITTGMIGYTMSSDFSTFGAVESGDYLAEWDKTGKTGRLGSHWKLSVLGKEGALRWRIPEIDGNLNYSPQAGENYRRPYKTGIFLHSTNESGWAGITAWNNETGRPFNGVSTGCLLLSPKDFKLLNQKMTGYNSFLVRVIR